MKRKDYTKPEVQVVNLKMSHTLLSSSPTYETTGATTKSGGSFGARSFNGSWDDDE